MSVRTELARLESAKLAIKAAIEAQGVEVPNDALLSVYAEYIAQIISLPLPEGPGEWVLVCHNYDNGYSFSWEQLSGDIMVGEE